MVSSYKTLAKNSLIVLFSNFAVLALNFFFVFLGLRFVGLYFFGVFTLLSTILGFVEQFITLGIFPVMVSEIARSVGQKNIPEAKSLLYRFAQTQAVLSVAGAIVFFAVAYFNFFHLIPDFQYTIYAFALYLVFIFPKNVFSIAFESHQRFDLSARFVVVESIAKLAVLGVLLWSGYSGSVLGLALAVLAGIVAGTLSIVRPFISLVRSWLSVARQKTNLFSVLAKEQGIFAFLTHQVKNVQMNLYPWIIKFFLGVEAVAVFAVLQKLQGAVMKVVQPLDSTLLPLVSEMDKVEDIRPFHNRISKYSFWISFGAFILISALVPFVLKPYIGQSFPGQEMAMVILLAALPFYALGFPIRSVLFRFREQAFITKLVFVTTIILFGATIVLTYYFGLVGAALATLLFYASDLIIRKGFVSRKYSVDFSFSSFFSYDPQDRLFVQRVKQKIVAFFSKKAV